MFCLTFVNKILRHCHSCWHDNSICGKSCTECKRNNVSIREIDMQTSYETGSRMQSMDT